MSIKFISNVDQSFMWQTTNMNQPIPADAVKVSEGVYSMTPAEVVEQEEVVPPRAAISIPQFKSLFTLTERVAITESTDAGVKILWADIEDQRTTEIHLDLPYVIEGINHLESIECIGAGRALEILS